MLAALSGFTHAESVTVEEMRVRSTDGAMIQTWIVKPARAAGRLPVLFAIHGGPIGAFGDGWHWRWNALLWANAGYMVVLPNARGSTSVSARNSSRASGATSGRTMLSRPDGGRRCDRGQARCRPRQDRGAGRLVRRLHDQLDRGQHQPLKALAPMPACTRCRRSPASPTIRRTGCSNMGGDRTGKCRRSTATPRRASCRTEKPHPDHPRRARLPVPGGRRARVVRGAAAFRRRVRDRDLSRREPLGILKPRNIVAWNAALLDFMGRHLG